MYAQLIMAAALAAAGFLGGWEIQGWRKDSAAGALEKARNEAIRVADAKHDAQVKALQAQSDAAAASLASAESTTLTKIGELNAENEKLRANVAGGRSGLRINATCPASQAKSGMPQAAASAAPDPAANPRLNGDAEQNYFALRQGIIQVTEQLALCQKYASSK